MRPPFDLRALARGYTHPRRSFDGSRAPSGSLSQRASGRATGARVAQRATTAGVAIGGGLVSGRLMPSWVCVTG